MLSLTPDQAAPVLREWVDVDQPRLQAAGHVLTTGNGACLVDRWPRPRAAVVVSGTNYALLGDPEALDSDALRIQISGFIETTPAFARLLREVDPSTTEWPRIIQVQPSSASQVATPGAEVRRLSAADAHHMWALSAVSNWISNSWGGPAALAGSGTAFGAFVDGRLVSLACPFFVTERFEDLGVVTEPGYRGRGLSPACAAAVCADVHARGRQPSWTTSPDNTQSLRVAAKLGFVEHHRDVLWVIGRQAPRPPDRPEAG
jgi:RimJ/RimL family protein N-acetyltransferase